MKNFFQLAFVLFAFLAFDSNAYAQLSWKKYDGKIPKNVVMGGQENGQKLPVCRCEHKGGTHPGKVVKNMCHIGWGGKEVYLKTYELLVHNSATQISWETVSGNKLPANAFKGGSENGKPMYVGQAIFSRGGRSAGTHPGKIFAASNGTLICNFGYGGTEVVAKSNFSVLTEKAFAPSKIDPNYWYRLTTQWQKDGKALDVINDGKNNNKLQLAKTGNYSGQYWKFTPVGKGFYRMTTKWQGDGKSLDVINDGKNNKVHLAKTGNYSGQFWKLIKVGGFYRLTTSWQGDGKSLDIVNDGKNNNIVHLPESGNYSGQYWKLTKIQAIKSEKPTKPIDINKPTKPIDKGGETSNQNTRTGKTHKAWLWYNNTSSKAAYTLANSYQYNSAGGAIQGERLNTGHYKITIPNFGKLYNGICQASAYNGSHSAQVERWTASGNDLQVFVRTFDAKGTAVDGQFSAIFYKEARNNVNSAYTWVSSEGKPKHNYHYNGKKGGINVTKKGTGMYNVTFEGITPNTTGEKMSGGFEGFKGNVLATPYGSQARRCKVINWQNSANGLSVNIATTDFNGQPADSKFVVSYSSDNTNQAAFVWANSAKSGTTYTPNTTYQMNNAGTADNTITRTGVGTYRVTLPGLKASSASNVIVTPYGRTNAYANIVRWVGNSAKGTDVTIKCFAPDGTPIDSQFSLLYTTNTPTKATARPVGQSNPNTKTNIRTRRGRN